MNVVLKDKIMKVKKVKFGIRKAFEDGEYQAYFTIGVQRFFLQPVESRDHAKWYVEQLKVAFENLNP